MFAVALAVGFRVEGTVIDAILATLLLFGFSYAFTWIQAFIGLSVKSVEAANSAGFIWMFPLTFVSSAFVDTASMPSWLRPVADANPFTVATNACRALYNGRDPGNDPWIAGLWAIGITILFAILSARRFNNAARH
jgi:ABC-2 type transport system permease protein/oleandomycin transport system permease protein